MVSTNRIIARYVCTVTFIVSSAVSFQYYYVLRTLRGLISFECTRLTVNAQWKGLGVDLL